MINIKIEQFEGPLALLIHLIEKEEMDITNVRLSDVADQFVAYIKQAEGIHPEVMADFLVIAAKLLLAKSRALLPYLFPEEDEDLVDLEKQLKMYKEFLEAAKKIETMLGEKKFMFPREFNRKVAVSGLKKFSPPLKLTKEALGDVYEAFLERQRPVEKMQEEVLDHKLNIEERIMNIQEMMMKKIMVSFNRILESARNKTEIIVSFLAALELMRQREVVLTQEVMFGEIFINRNGG
jgi:segregation and condensation protein A